MEENVLQSGVSIRPILDFTDVKNIIFQHYGFQIVSVVELNGYDDKNFHVKVEKNCVQDGWSEDGYVFKVINSLDSKKPCLFDAQNLLLFHLNTHGIKCPKPVSTKEGVFYKKLKLKSGEHMIRLFEYIKGTILQKTTCKPEIFYQIGEMAAKIDIGLQDFHHPAYDNHKTLWMLDSFPKVKDFLFVLQDEGKRSMCADIIKEFEERVIPNIDRFEKGMIHGDINEQNILVEEINGKLKIKAILDFGDSYRGCYLFELAIMMTYMILEAKDLNVGAYILAGYFSLKKISEEEYKLLKICICSRLCTSLVMGAYTYSLDPSNTYLLITSRNGWQILEQLRNESDEELLKRWKTMAQEYNILI